MLEELEFGAGFGQVHGEGGIVLDGEGDEVTEEVGVDAVGGVGGEAGLDF